MLYIPWKRNIFYEKNNDFFQILFIVTVEVTCRHIIILKNAGSCCFNKKTKHTLSAPAFYTSQRLTFLFTKTFFIFPEKN